MSLITFPAETTRTIRKTRSAALRLTQEVHNGSTVVTPDSATFELVDGAGTSLASGAATIGADGIAYFDLSAAATASAELGDDYLEHWEFTIGSDVYGFRRDAAIVLRELFPVITDTDVLRGHPELADIRDEDRTSWEEPRAEAWYEILAWLQQTGRRPWLIMSSRVLRDLHLFLTRHIVYRGLSSTPRGDQGAFPQTRDYYWQRYEAARDSLKLEAYDVRETGNMDDAAEDVPAKGNIWLGPAPTRRRVA